MASENGDDDLFGKLLAFPALFVGGVIGKTFETSADLLGKGFQLIGTGENTFEGKDAIEAAKLAARLHGADAPDDADS